MSMIKVNLDIDNLNESSLDNSADCEYLEMVDDKPYGAPLAYKIIPMTTKEMSVKSTPSPPLIVEPETTQYYVIHNPGEVFATTAAPKKSPKESLLKIQANTTKKRDERRRVTHNEVERRRRDKINSWITKLAALIPNSGLSDTTSKGNILSKACDYIVQLTGRQKRLEKLEAENDKLVLEVLRLNQELAEVRKENSTMRNQLADNCIVTNYRPKGQKS